MIFRAVAGFAFLVLLGAAAHAKPIKEMPDVFVGKYCSTGSTSGVQYERVDNTKGCTDTFVEIKKHGYEAIDEVCRFTSLQQKNSDTVVAQMSCDGEGGKRKAKAEFTWFHAILYVVPK